jgi:hypothetical protein
MGPRAATDLGVLGPGSAISWPDISFEAIAAPHDWGDWYAAYMDARQSGSTPEEASTAAERYMADVKHVVVPPA